MTIGFLKSAIIMVGDIRIQFYLFFKATAVITFASSIAVIQTMFAVYICFLVIIRNYFSPPEKKKGQVSKKISKLALTLDLLFICLKEYREDTES